MKIKAWITAAVLALSSTGVLAATEGVDYVVLPKAMPQVQKDKVEVLEFFAYWCTHCRDMESVIGKHSKTFASDTYFRREHVVWDPKNDLNFARLAAAVELAGLGNQANPVIFDAVVRDRINLSNSDTLKAWLNQQTQFDGKKVLAQFQSFNSQTGAKQMGENTASYEIQSTPTVIVGGKYRVEFSKGFVAGMKIIDELVVKVRQERGMKAPVAKVSKPVRSKGARLVKQSIR